MSRERIRGRRVEEVFEGFVEREVRVLKNLYWSNAQ